VINWRFVVFQAIKARGGGQLLVGERLLQTTNCLLPATNINYRFLKSPRPKK
jgi:hypothetical protein